MAPARAWLSDDGRRSVSDDLELGSGVGGTDDGAGSGVADGAGEPDGEVVAGTLPPARLSCPGT
jgi:hypothetical protein